MSREFRTQNRSYKYLGRRADGTVCCRSDAPDAMCSRCKDHVEEVSTDGPVPPARRLADALNKTGYVPPTPGKVNLHGVPRPQSLADAIQSRRGGRR
jgi:hypothetical protein